MKKLLTLTAILVLFLALVSCGGGEDKPPVIESDYPEEFTERFMAGNWSRPGLYDKEGNPFTMPSPVEEKGMVYDVTDYGAKGNDANFDNYTAFKKAVDDAQPGDTVYVPDGRYYFKNYTSASSEYFAHIVLKAGITFKGESAEGVVLVSNFLESVNRDYGSTVIAVVNARDVMIKNVTVTSNTDDSMLPDPDNQNLQTFVYTAPKYGITIAGGGLIADDNKQPRNVYVDNVIVEKFQRMGIRIAKAQQIVITNSTFRKATCLGGGGMGYGINIQGSGPGISVTDTFIDTRYVVVENNKFVGPYLRHGALIQYGAHNNLVKDNVFTDHLLDAIDLHGEGEFSNEITGNTVTNTRKGGSVGIGNTGATHAGSGTNNYVHNNVFEKGDRAIDVILGSFDSVIYNNVIKDMKKGITCSNANGTIIMNNTISNLTGTALSISYSYVYEDPSLGIPDNYLVKGNTFKNVDKGIVIDSRGENVVFTDNVFEGVETQKQIVDTSSSFVVPPKSTLMDKVEGTILLPTDNNFISTEYKNSPVTFQKNMKFKASNLEPQFNRMIYAKFDRSEAPSTYEKVYLSFTAKAQTGAPTINIWVNETYTDWTQDTIYWNGSLLHHETLAIVKQTEEHPLKEIYTFEFPIVSYEFNTYYIDITEGYEEISAYVFTMVFSNEAIDESYMEVYSKEQNANDQAFRLIFK